LKSLSVPHENEIKLLPRKAWKWIYAASEVAPVEPPSLRAKTHILLCTLEGAREGGVISARELGLLIVEMSDFRISCLDPSSVVGEFLLSFCTR